MNATQKLSRTQLAHLSRLDANSLQETENSLNSTCVYTQDLSGKFIHSAEKNDARIEFIATVKQ